MLDRTHPGVDVHVHNQLSRVLSADVCMAALRLSGRDLVGNSASQVIEADQESLHQEEYDH